MSEVNPFLQAGYPYPNQPEMTNLVDQAVVLNTALVPKLPEINIVDGMVPIIDKVYCDSGSPSEFTPGTTINFNFGNHKGKLIDWTQSRLNFTVSVAVTVRDNNNVPAGAAAKGTKKCRGCLLGSKNVRLCLRQGAMVFSQITIGGSGRPLTITDFEMCSLAKQLLTLCESNVRSRIGELTTKDFPGCSVMLTDTLPTDDASAVRLHLKIPVSIPVTNVIPLFQNVDNYLNSVTTGVELRLTVTSNDNIFCFTSTEPMDRTNSVSKSLWQSIAGWFKDDTVDTTQISNKQFYKHFIPNGSEIAGVPQKYDGGEYPTDENTTHTITAHLQSLSDVHIDLISTERPDDNVTNLLTEISMTRGLFYPHQMYVCTPYNFVFDATKRTSHNVLVPLVSGYNNLDTMFIWFTKRGEYTNLVKLPIRNLYTSLNGTYKTPTHNYNDVVWENMTETAHQFNRAFGTSNSTILSPLHEVMDSYSPSYTSNQLKSNGYITSEAEKYQQIALAEYTLSDSFIANCTIWELEKSSWMSGPDLGNYNNKYQIVFDIDQIYPAGATVHENESLTLWVCQRCDCYTHIRNGFMQLLTSKKEVAIALQAASAGAPAPQ